MVAVIRDIDFNTTATSGGNQANINGDILSVGRDGVLVTAGEGSVTKIASSSKPGSATANSDSPVGAAGMCVRACLRACVPLK